MNLSIVLCTYIISGPRYFFYILLETSYEGEGLDKFGEIKVLDDNGLFFYFASLYYPVPHGIQLTNPDLTLKMKLKKLKLN